MISLVAVVVFFSVWQSIFPPPVPVDSVSQEKLSGDHKLSDLTVEKIAGQAEGETIEIAEPSPSVTPSSLKPITRLHTLRDEHRFEVEFNSRGDIDQWSILESQYRHRLSETETVPYVLSTREPLMKEGGGLIAPFLTPTMEVKFNNELVQGEYTIEPGSNATNVSFVMRTAKLEVRKRYEVKPGEYRLRSHVEVKNLSGARAHIEVLGIARAVQDSSASEGGMFTPPLNLLESICAYGDDFERDSYSYLLSKLEDKDPVSFTGARWFGVDSRYFMISLSGTQALTCTQSVDPKLLSLKAGVPAGFSPLSTSAVYYADFVNSAEQVKSEVTFYGGPKQLDLLAAVEPSLNEAIDFGIFSPICYLMLWAMGLFFSWLPNWGLAIILLTVLVKLLTLPLTLKQYRSMAAMKKIQPELSALKEQHKDDPMRMQQETMALYKKHGANPLSGCLPMLVMMPIYFALYRTIYSAVELYQAHFIGWLHDLSMPDPYFVTPVVLAGLMFLQAQLQPTNSAMDPAQRKMLTTFMPLMFGGMMLFLPSGLVLYILVNTALGLVQQQWSQRSMEAKG